MPTGSVDIPIRRSGRVGSQTHVTLCDQSCFWLARAEPPFCAGEDSSAIIDRGAQISLLCARTSTGSGRCERSSR